MATSGQARQTHRWVAASILRAWRTRRVARTVTGVTLGLLVMLLTGCSQAPTTAKQNHDPLHGILTPPGQPPQPGGAGKPSNPYATTPTDPPNATPTSFSSTNPATLAIGSGQGPLGRPLAIDDNGKPYPTGAGGYPGPNPTPRVEPVPDIGPAPMRPANDWKTPQIPAPNGASQIPTEQSLYAQLQSRGVLQQKQDAVPEGIRLTCYVSRGPEGGLRAVEVTAGDYSAAAQTMLQQLEAKR